jgi:F0F1-type ATP synthase assembly protein I
MVLPSDPGRARLWQHLFAGTSFAVTILVGVYLGVLADHHWSTDPWGTLIGCAVGFSAALINLVREFSDDTRKK